MGKEKARRSVHQFAMRSMAHIGMQERIENAGCVAPCLHPMGLEHQARDFDRAISNTGGSQG